MYRFKGRAIAVTGSHFGDAQEIHQLKQWNCRSTETTIAYCSKALAYRYCSSSETAGVYCQGKLYKITVTVIAGLNHIHAETIV